MRQGEFRVGGAKKCAFYIKNVGHSIYKTSDVVLQNTF